MAMKVRYTVIEGEVVSEVRSGTRRDYLPDPLGSTVALLDNTQAKTDTWEYWPYGEVRTRTGTTATPFQFVGTLGYYRDSSTRTYVRARHCKQNQGRWLTVDPLWPKQLAYQYVKGKPQTLTDGNGMLPIGLVIGLINGAECAGKVDEVINDITGGGNPLTCGKIRRCIGQYLGGAPECGQHGGGHGFSGLFGMGCCIQVQIDLCVLLSPITRSNGLKCATVPSCLDDIIRDFYGGKNPLGDCLCLDNSGSCPPGYCWEPDPNYPLLMGRCRECTLVLPWFGGETIG